MKIKTVKIVHHILTLSDEEKEILQKAQCILKEIHKNDGYAELWERAYDWCGDACDFHDISNYLLFLTDSKNDSLTLKESLEVEE